MTNRDEGVSGEDTAVTALKKKGYTIIERNHRNKLGEIDIIAEQGGCLVFIEVKKRNTDRYGLSIDAVDGRKQKRIIRSAMLYMKIHDYFNRKVRFDVVGIDRGELTLIKNAFLVEDDRR
jgi:putative endonuclease